MKTIPPAMQADLDGRATTHCYCWAIDLGATILGFTNCNTDLTFDGITFSAETGLDTSALTSSSKLEVDDVDAVGILDSATITEQAIRAGQYDNTLVRLWKVDWSNTDNRVLLNRGVIGDVVRGSVAYKAQVKSLSAYAQQKIGRNYSAKCGADLGDDDCKVDMTGFTHADITITEVLTQRAFTVTSGTITTATSDSDYFHGGKIFWPDGSESQIAFSEAISENVFAVELIEPASATLTVGSLTTMTAGCKKVMAVCRVKFSNDVNYFGFNRVPKQDHILSSPAEGELNDGSSLYA